MAGWLKIRNEYVSGSISYRKLAEKHGVSFNTLKSRAVRRVRRGARKATSRNYTKTQQKGDDVVPAKEADRIGRMLSTIDLLLAKIEEAASQLDTLNV